MIEPISEALTISNSPAETSSTARISSVKLPKVALRRPPTRGPEWMASESVARPIRPASGTIARQEVAKMTNGWPPVRSATNEIGTKISSQ